MTSRFDSVAQSKNLTIEGLPSTLLPATVQIANSTISHQHWHTGRSFKQRLADHVGQELTMVHLNSAESRAGRLPGFNGAYVEFEYQGSVLRYPINGADEARALEYLVDVNEQWSLVDSSQLATVEGMQARWLVEVPAYPTERVLVRIVTNSSAAVG